MTNSSSTRKEYVDFAEAMKILNCNEATVRNLVEHGHLSPFRRGDTVVFEKSVLTLMEPDLVTELQADDPEEMPIVTHELKALASRTNLPIVKIQFDSRQLADAIRFYLMAKLTGELSDLAREAKIFVVDTDGEERDFANMEIRHIEAQISNQWVQSKT